MPGKRRFEHRPSDRTKKACKCGAPTKTVEVIIQARPIPPEEGVFKTRARRMCEDCAVELFEKMEVLLDG